MKMKKLLTLLAISTSSIASPQPTADIFFTQLVVLRDMSPLSFEAAYEFNRATLLKCGRVKSLNDVKNDTSFQAVLQYLVQNDGKKDDDFNSDLDQLTSNIECE